MVEFTQQVAPIVLSTNLIDEDYPAWSAEAAYNENDLIIFDGNIYKALATNSDEPPEKSLKWLKLGATNSRRFYDGKMDTHSSAENELMIELDISEVEVITLFGINAHKIRFECAKIGDSYETRAIARVEIDLIERQTPTGNWYDFAFTKWIYRRNLQRFVLTPRANLKARITLTKQHKTDLTALALGKRFALGVPLAGVNVSFDSYSTKEIDHISKGGVMRVVEADLLVENGRLDGVVRELEKVEAVATAWQISDGAQILNLYGFLDSASSTVAGADNETVNIRIVSLKEN